MWSQQHCSGRFIKGNNIKVQSLLHVAGNTREGCHIPFEIPLFVITSPKYSLYYHPDTDILNQVNTHTFYRHPSYIIIYFIIIISDLILIPKCSDISSCYTENSIKPIFKNLDFHNIVVPDLIWIIY